MKTNVLIILLLALALPATPIFAAGVMHQRSAVQAVQARFQDADTSVCSEGLVTNVVVIGELGWIAGNGKKIDVSAVSLGLFARDECTGTELMFATGQTNANYDLRIDPNLNTATLHVRLLVHDDFTETDSYYDIDMVWTGIGQTQKEAIHDKEHSPDLIENEHAVIDTRAALVSGTVISLSTGQNFTPGASVDASLMKIQGGGNDVPIH